MKKNIIIKNWFIDKGMSDQNNKKQVRKQRKKRMSKVGPTGNTKDRAKAWVFTINNPEVDKHVKLIEKFKKEDDKINVEEYVFQMERGKKGTIHLQGYIKFTKKHTFNVVKDYIDKRCHLEKCRKINKSISYCCKCDTRIAGPYTNIENLEFRETIKDPLKDIELYEWQEDVVNIVNSEPDKRTIYWYYDEIGNTGKSALVKHLILNYGVIVLGGLKNDMFYALTKLIDDNKNIKNIVVDVPRAIKNKISMSAFEEIKNGVLFSGKYESKSIVFNNPNIIIFANFEPNYEKLSLDRWKVFNIEELMLDENMFNAIYAEKVSLGENNKNLESLILKRKRKRQETLGIVKCQMSKNKKIKK